MEAAQQSSTRLSPAIIDIIAEAIQRAENVPNDLAEFRSQLMELGIEGAQTYADAELQRQHAVWLRLKAQIEAYDKEAAEEQRAAAAEAKWAAAKREPVDVELLSATARRNTVQTGLGELQQQEQEQQQQQQQQEVSSHGIEAERARLARGWTLLDAVLILLHKGEQRLEARKRRFEQDMQRREQLLVAKEQDNERSKQLLMASVQQFEQESVELEHAWA
ncbi:hypothetical protein N2152v2_009821 [Parachlorella kessleri]